MEKRIKKYTSGPWDCGGEVSESLAHFDNGQHNIYPPIGEIGPIAEVGGQANAHLIAAAPELLEALEWMLDAMSSLAKGKPVRDLDERALFTGKAIAKAYGEES